jgi:hypothetical protein
MSGRLNLLRLDVRKFHHLAPFLGFFGDQLAEIGGRARKCSGAQLGKPRLHLGIGKSRVDLLVELLHDLGRRGPRCADAVPGARLETRHKFVYGRDVGQRVRASRGGYCERAQPTSPDIPYRRDSAGEHHLHLPAEQIGKRQPGTTIGHMNHVGP